MHFIYRLVLLSFLVVFPPKAFTSDIQIEIQQLLEYFADEWNLGELDSLRAHLHRDFVLISTEGDVTQNKDQRLKDLELIMAPDSDQGVLSFSGIHAEMLGEEHVLVFGRSNLKFKDGTEMGGMFSSVYVKSPFGWKVILSHD